MEREPIFENGNEQISEQKLIQLLEEKGVEDPEVKKILIKWTKEQEKKVEESDDPEAPIQFNLRRARLYFKAGYYKEAFENFKAALMQAYQERRDELYQKIEEEINEIKDSIKKEK